MLKSFYNFRENESLLNIDVESGSLPAEELYKNIPA